MLILFLSHRWTVFDVALCGPCNADFPKPVNSGTGPGISGGRPRCKRDQSREMMSLLYHRAPFRDPSDLALDCSCTPDAMVTYVGQFTALEPWVIKFPGGPCPWIYTGASDSLGWPTRPRFMSSSRGRSGGCAVWLQRRCCRSDLDARGFTSSPVSQTGPESHAHLPKLALLFQGRGRVIYCREGHVGSNKAFLQLEGCKLPSCGI